MSTELAIRSMDDLARVADMFARSGLFRDTADAAQAGVKIMAGQAWGIDPFSSMVGIALIQGKPVIGAGIMAAKVKGHPKYDFLVRRLDEDGCSIEFFQGERSLGVSTFTMDDAKNAGYAGKQNYRQTPRNMLFARALSNGVRWYTPDVFSSSVYTPEDFNQEGEVSVEVVPSATPASRVEKPVERPALEAPAPAPAPEPVAVPAPSQAADGMVTDDQKVELGAAFKAQAVPPKNRIGFLRYAVRPDLATIHHLTGAEADEVLGWTGDEWSEKLAAYAVELEGGPPDVSDVVIPDRPVEFDPTGTATRQPRKGAAA
jgi:hypothetical protein